MEVKRDQYFEYIVIGCGGVGSGALYWLSKRVGTSVLGLEQFELGHHNGGSQDVSRIIRLMYQDERYTKLTPYTFEAWDEVEKESGMKLYHKTGGLELTRKSCPRVQVMEEYATAMTKQRIPFERLSGAGIRNKFPQFQVGDDVIGLYQKEGGLVDAALANAVHVQLAQGNGATVLSNCPVTRLESTPNGGSRVHTPKGVFSCRRVVVTAGAWVNHVLGSVGVHIPVIVTQEQVTYYATPHIKKFTKENFPIYIWHDNDLDIYGLPVYGNTGTKIGIDAGGNIVTADTRTFNPDPVREKACTDFLKNNIPEAVGPVLYSKTCLYTMTKDRHFVVDTLASRGLPQILVCCGAGHVFKFASLIGRILSELAVDGKTRFDISGFPFERVAVTDPNFKRAFGVTYNRSTSRL